MELIGFHKKPAGYGHYQLTVDYSGKTFSYTTSNMPLIDKINSEDNTESIEAIKGAIKLVLDNNGIENYNIAVDYSARSGNDFYIAFGDDFHIEPGGIKGNDAVGYFKIINRPFSSEARFAILSDDGYYSTDKGTFIPPDAVDDYSFVEITEEEYWEGVNV